jgi:hypothetical protein
MLALNEHGDFLRALPGFPVGLRGVDTLHAPFFTERRTRCFVQRCVAGNPGRPAFLLDFVALIHMGTHSGPALSQRQPFLETFSKDQLSPSLFGQTVPN